MIKKLLVGLSILAMSIASYAKNDDPTFSFLPNIKTQQMLTAQTTQNQNSAIEIVKKSLNITANSPYKAIKIGLFYNPQSQIQTIFAYLLSSQNKSFEIVKIDLNKNQTIASVTRDYNLQPNDMSQSPHYVKKMTPVCPDESVQFVIGNVFHGDTSVEKEVQYVYQLAKDKGYNPFLMTVNNPNGPQPTIEAYENWMSCHNVKGFYNEAHGSPQGIMLADNVFMYSLIERDLFMKLYRDVILFDSCSTFKDPLLSAITDFFKGNAKQYMAGIIPLPFGSSERTASCFWTDAFNHQQLTQELISTCANKYGLHPLAFRIKGNGKKFLSMPRPQ